MSLQSGYLSEDTIAAIASAVGGAISVIRLSGPRTFSVLEKMTHSASVINWEPRKLICSPLFSDKGEQIDSALVVRFVQPHSYTGEDSAELHLHGGQFVAHRILETLAFFGVRQALPGEFSFRAVRNGKMSLFQAQAVSDLISATNDGAISLAVEKLSGFQNKKIEDLAIQLRRMAVLGEVGIDFADQDIEEVSLPYLKQQLLPIYEILRQLRESYTRGIRLQDGISVAFIGLPNAGKSSFFNALLGEDRSIVSETAGTTRDVIREKLTLRGRKSTLTLRLEDTAGLRIADNSVEKIGIERTHQAGRKADLILFIVDPTTSFESVKDEWNRFIGASPQSFINKTLGILTKSDQVTFDQLQQFSTQCRTLGIPTWNLTSALTGEGISEAINNIVEFCEHWTHRNPGEMILTRLDHVTAVNHSLEHLQRAQEAPEIDLFAADIRQALYALGPLIGETLPDTLLEKIFSDFCIGK